MKILEILFGKTDINRAKDKTASTRVREVILGTDEKSQVVDAKSSHRQDKYNEAGQQARLVVREGKKLVKMLDTLSAIAIETGGRERGFEK
jgi:hypothetical protein